MQYQVVAIPHEISQQTRETLKSPQYGHPAQVALAKGYGPCRSCLQTFREGQEERILFTYQPFSEAGALPSPGPIFIHRDACERFEESGFPAALRRLPLTLEGYEQLGLPVAREQVKDGDAEAVISRIFSNSKIAYIHIRNTEAGCFIARIERVERTGNQ
jgi:hypothetical protein